MVKTALIMAAGYGTRLEPLTLAIPKPMVPIVNKPTMRHNIELLRRHGIRQIVANIHYHPEQIMNYFSDGNNYGIDLNYSYEETLMGTAGGVKRMACDIAQIDGTFVVLSSDALTDINLRKLIEFHKKKKSKATLALCPVDDIEGFGVVEVGGNGEILQFKEKPKAHEVSGNLVNTGIYVFEPEILDLIPKDKFYDFGKELFPILIEQGIPIFGYRMVEYWSDVGTISAYMRANHDAMQGRVRTLIPGKKVSSCVWVGKHCRIDPSVKFEGCVIIGDRCEIRKDVILKDAIVGDMCVIGVGVNISESSIWSDSYISKGTSVKKSIIGNWCRIEEDVTIEENCVISNRSLVRRGNLLPKGTTLNPREAL
ncbi:NDP-sugar synthase [Candidatus Saganbacteria bacterium]|nr:NDP-sugar synthase [Candidatus Saganbacteria bacterium]